jgi:hypothetical protein
MKRSFADTALAQLKLAAMAEVAAVSANSASVFLRIELSICNQRTTCLAFV